MRAEAPAIACAIAFAASESGAASGARGPTRASMKAPVNAGCRDVRVDLDEFATGDAAPDQPAIDRPGPPGISGAAASISGSHGSAISA